MTSELIMRLPIPSAKEIFDVNPQDFYQQNCSRIYSLAFWVTGHELDAEQVTASTFARLFLGALEPTPDLLERALIAELREYQTLGTLTLECDNVADVHGVRMHAKKADLEVALLQLPATERLIYLMHDGEAKSFSHIGRLLGLEPTEVQSGLHQARLRLRELLCH